MKIFHLKSWFIKKDLSKFKNNTFFHGNAGDLLNRVHKLNELNKLRCKHFIDFMEKL